MNIEKELKKDGIEVIGTLDTLSVNAIAHNVAEKICNAFPEQNFVFQNLFIALSRVPMYIAKMPEGYAEANYFYKNSSVYFKAGVSSEELEKFAIHEFIHYLQEIKDKRGNLVRLGLCEHSDFRVLGTALNEGAVQLMTSKALKQDQEIVKYYGISLPTTSPNYYPVLCNLVEQMAYIAGEDNLVDSTFYGSNTFKENFANLCGMNTLIKVQNNLDKIMNTEEKIILLNQVLLSDTCEGTKAQKIAKKILTGKEEIKKLYFETQNIIYRTYFDKQFEKIITTADIDSYRLKLYNYKNYIGITDTYFAFNDYYINKMMDLDNKYEKILNSTDIAVISNSKLARFFRKVKALLNSKVELSVK